MGDEETGRPGDKENEEEEEEQPVSRIVVEFVGPGMADVKRTEFENISVGQMMAFATWAEWQKDQAIFRMEMQRQKELERRAQLEKIVIPRGVRLQ